MIDFLNSNQKISGEEDLYLKPPIIVKIISFIFSLIIVFASVDYFVIAPSEIKISKFFLDGFIMSKFFSLLDILIIITSGYFILFQNLSFKNSTIIERILFILAILCYILNMANPNNGSENPVLGLPLFSDISNYSYLLFFGTIISIPKKMYYFFVIRIFKYSAYIVVFRAILLLALFAAGQSRSFFFGIKSCLLEGDTLLILGFYQTMFLVLYLVKKDKKYLAAWGLLLLVQIFSTRRSPLFTALFCNVIVFGYYYVRKMSALNKIATIFVLSFSLLVLPGIISNVSPKAKVYIDRYMGVFSTDNYGTDSANSDSGHFEQSQKTTEAALKIGFWGVGYGHKLILDGAFSINGEYFIHNVYAALWVGHGVYMVIFYLLIILFVFAYFLKLLVFQNKELFYFALVKMGVIAFFLMYMNAMYYTTLNFLVSSKIEYILLLMICFILKFNKAEFEELSSYFETIKVKDGASKNKYLIEF